MAFILRNWLLLGSLLPFCYSHGSVQYECGPHGRFEYCIDGIPGCVIGCHCHPGYYFDTDTKVCEPNIKLTQEFRRNYVPEPTRIQNSMLNSQIATTDLTPTLTNPVDAKIDEITKDADDLGDWLYNQFFKTIENQVINSTDENEQLLTRRSGSMVKRKPNRKNHKHSKKTGKKLKRRKKGLKKKHLRITEDDSLFDSSSSATSDEASSSSSSESETDTSSDSDRNAKDHGHKKIIIFNKKPKPPLPSFIFLPNMDTPFYPPIGLPPPPIVPMYPFVPVPPVAPILPYPGFTTQCGGNEISSTVPTSPLTTTTTTTTPRNSVSKTTTVVSNASSVSSSEPTAITTVATSETTTAKLSFRARGSPLYGEMLSTKNKQVKRNKLLQKLKDKIDRRNKLTHIRPFPDDYIDLEEPLMDTISKPDYGRPLKSNGIEEEMPMEEVDFKYLTELIHRVDLNNTRKPLQYSKNPRIPSGGRRNYYLDPKYLPEPVQIYHGDTPHRTRTKNLDDTYYSNLGRQIATMIRKIDTNGERQIDIEVEKDNVLTPEHPVFSENSHASRSFWERSVRSPLKTYFKPRDSKFAYLNHSNENLFNLENKVEVAVTTNPPLSLRDIENIINKLEHTKVTVKKTKGSITAMPSRKSYNVDLLIKNPNCGKNCNLARTIQYEHVPQRDNFYRFLMNNDQKRPLLTSTPTIKTDHSVILNTRNKTLTKKLPQALSNYALKIPMMGYLKLIKNVPTSTTTNKPIVYRPNPIPYNHKSYNYFNNNNHYIYEKTSYPYYFSTIIRNYNPPVAKPSYFRHELHNFDYFDEYKNK